MSDKTPYDQLAAIDGLTFSDCVAFFGRKATERDKQIVALAKADEREGELEIDDHFAITSEGDDNGSYVLAWVWVDFAGTPLDKDGKDEDEEAGS